MGKYITHIFFEPNNYYSYVGESAFKGYSATKDRPYAYALKEVYLPKTVTELK
jgi:hypothetical protein